MFAAFLHFSLIKILTHRHYLPFLKCAVTVLPNGTLSAGTERWSSSVLKLQNETLHVSSAQHPHWPHHHQGPLGLPLTTAWDAAALGSLPTLTRTGGPRVTSQPHSALSQALPLPCCQSASREWMPSNHSHTGASVGQGAEVWAREVSLDPGRGLPLAAPDLTWCVIHCEHAAC